MIVGGRPDMILPADPELEGAHLWSGILEKDKLEIQDHGAPFQGEGAGCIVLDLQKKHIYGVAYPTPIVFDYDMTAGTFGEGARLGPKEDIEKAITWLSPCERVSKSPRTLFLGPAGSMYGAWSGQLFSWTPPRQEEEQTKDAKQVRILKNRIPAASERKNADDRRAAGDGVIVESFVVGSDGRLYGGTYDGYLFASDLKTEKIVNLGKPFRQGRIRALAASDDRIFGLCGESTGHGRVFSYSAADGYNEIEIQGAKFRCDTLDALAVAQNGMIFIGGAGRMTALYIYKP